MKILAYSATTLNIPDYMILRRQKNGYRITVAAASIHHMTIVFFPWSGKSPHLFSSEAGPSESSFWGQKDAAIASRHGETCKTNGNFTGKNDDIMEISWEYRDIT